MRPNASSLRARSGRLARPAPRLTVSTRPLSGITAQPCFAISRRIPSGRSGRHSNATFDPATATPGSVICAPSTSSISSPRKPRHRQPARGSCWPRFRSFCGYCVSVERIAQNPTVGIKGPRVKSDGHHTRTDEEIAQFEKRHPIGSLARLAEGLHLFTAQRSSDVLRMGSQHIRDGVLAITQQKTGTAVAIPVHPTLQCILDAVPLTTDLTFLHAAAGKRFTDYNGRWREWVKAAGLPKECVPHGLRKAAARRFAEAGCTAHEIMAITGHKTLAEVQRYTDRVEMMRLARQAVNRTIAAKTGT